MKLSEEIHFANNNVESYNAQIQKMLPNAPNYMFMLPLL